MKHRLLLVPFAVLALIATPFVARVPAEARCSQQTLAKLADSIQSAIDDIAQSPQFARSELGSVRQDLASCSATAGTNAEKWGLALLNELAKLGATASIVNEGRFSRARDEIRAERRTLATYRARAKGDATIIGLLDNLTTLASSIDERAHHGQRITSMKVAGNHLFDVQPASNSPESHIIPIPLSPRNATSSVNVDRSLTYGDPSLATPAASAAPAVASPAPTTPAAPAGSPAPPCDRPDVPATILRAVVPDTPALAQQQGITGTVQVIVSLDVDSHVVATRIRSSPSAILNSAALGAARQSTYQTLIMSCKPVASDLIFTANFPR
ncbi:MAG TPA: energy transducer TonB [Candidatus Elarobacter sp.]|jgi:hypothetical protein